jgi:hypothetical protein
MPLIAIQAPNIHTLICARHPLKYSTDRFAGDIEIEKQDMKLWAV